MAKYLAADIGASSGRIFEAVLNDRKIELREIFRFDDYLRYEEKTYFWDIEKIYGSIISGLKKYFNEKQFSHVSIRENQDIINAMSEKLDIFTYKNSSNGAIDYRNLVDEFLEDLK